MKAQIFKNKLHDAALAYVSELLSHAKEAMDFAQDSANNESKSSAGDKHEVGRAMGQLEKEKSARQFTEALKLKKVLLDINTATDGGPIRIGSAVETSEMNFYISVSAGKLNVDGQLFFAISAVSPIGATLISKSVGDAIQFNGKQIKILKVF